MGKHNYNAQYNNRFQNSRPAAPVEEVTEEVTEEAVEEVVEEAVEEVEEVKEVVKPVSGTTTGIVDNCDKLNVRISPIMSATPLAVISKDNEVQIDMANSTSEWYKVTTPSGVEGYCMKKFITIK